MSWQSIDNVKPAQVKADSVPADGVKVTPRALRARGSGETTRWINIEIGADLARKLSLVQESVKVRLLMGGGHRCRKDRRLGRRDRRQFPRQAKEAGQLLHRAEREERGRTVPPAIRAFPAPQGRGDPPGQRAAADVRDRRALGLPGGA